MGRESREERGGRREEGEQGGERREEGKGGLSLLVTADSWPRPHPE